jgi:hypothetical protein
MCFVRPGKVFLVRFFALEGNAEKAPVLAGEGRGGSYGVKQPSADPSDYFH